MSKKKARKTVSESTPRPAYQSKPQRRRSYDGARSDRLTADWATSSSSADGEAATSLRKLRDRSRDLARNYDLVNGLFSTLTNNIIGVGMQFQAKVTKPDGKTLDNDLNKKIEAEFETWCEAKNCHTAGTLAFRDIEYLIWRNLIESGDIFVRFITQRFGESKVPLGLELIEADQLAETYWVPPTLGSNIVAGGIELDGWGRKVAYWFWPNHPGDWRYARKNETMPFRVPADEVLHLYRSNRPNQHRGIPWLHCSLITMQHVRRFVEGEVVAARLQNAIAGFIKRPEDDVPHMGGEGDEGFEETFLEDLAPGAIEYLNPGEEFQGFAPNRPNSNAIGFIGEMHRGVAAGQGVSREGVTRDFGQVNYSSGRLAILEERKTYKIHQLSSIRQLQTPIFRHWLKMAVLSGVLPIKDYELDPKRYQRHIWMPQGWEWVDPEKDVKASILALRAGLTSYSKILGEKGQDVQEVWELLAQETAMAKELDLSLDLSTSGPGQPDPSQMEPDPPPDAAASKAFEDLILRR